MGRSHRTISLPLFPQKKKKKSCIFWSVCPRENSGVRDTNAVQDSGVNQAPNSCSGGLSPIQVPARRPKLLSVTSRRSGCGDSHLAGRRTARLLGMLFFFPPFFLSCSPMGIEAVIPGGGGGLRLFGYCYCPAAARGMPAVW